MGIPMELISMGASTVLGGILGIMAQASKDKAEQQKMLMTRADFQSKQFDKARNVTDQFTKNTRRYIALMCVMAIIVLPKLAPFIDPNIDIFVGYTEETIKVITPLDTHVVSSIIGLYFGGSLVRR